MGREFLNLFERWASTYDETTSGIDIEYREAFLHYTFILETVAEKLAGPVLEFGVGTGNLTQKILGRNLDVFGVEPSHAMRKIAQERMPNISIVDGDFLDFPLPDTQIQSITSTYAFHHLTDEEKAIAIQKFSDLLPSGGKVVFADTSFESKEAHAAMIEEAGQKGYFNLQQDLKSEYYTTLDVLESMFKSAGFDVHFSQCNRFVWLLEATKL